jgi:hypothetical protein
MRFLSIAGPTLAGLAFLSGCGGSGSSTPPAPQHPYWAVLLNAINHSQTCAAVTFYERENGGGWNGPIKPDDGSYVKSGGSTGTEFTYFPTTYNAQYRVQAIFFSHKNCSGTKTLVQAESQTLTNEARLNASLHGNPGSYAITLVAAYDN